MFPYPEGQTAFKGHLPMLAEGGYGRESTTFVCMQIGLRDLIIKNNQAALPLTPASSCLPAGLYLSEPRQHHLRGSTLAAGPPQKPPRCTWGPASSLAVVQTRLCRTRGHPAHPDNTREASGPTARSRQRRSLAGSL